MAWDALGWLFTSGNKRKKLLDPETTETDPTQDVDKNDNESTYFVNSRQKRGWGSVLQFSYADPLDKLQKELLVWEQYYNKAKGQGCATAFSDWCFSCKSFQTAHLLSSNSAKQC